MPERSTSKLIPFDSAFSASHASQITRPGEGFACRVAAGEIDPETAQRLLTTLAAMVGIADIEHFAQELHRMRETRHTHVAEGSKPMTALGLISQCCLLSASLVQIHAQRSKDLAIESKVRQIFMLVPTSRATIGC